MQVLDPIDGTRGFLRGEDALYVVHFRVDIHATYCLSNLVEDCLCNIVIRLFSCCAHCA